MRTGGKIEAFLSELSRDETGAARQSIRRDLYGSSDGRRGTPGEVLVLLARRWKGQNSTKLAKHVLDTFHQHQGSLGKA